MKSGKPLERRTPLAARQGTLKRSPIAPRRQKPRRRSREAQHGVPWPDVRGAIFVRCGGRCEACGCSITLADMEGHHRLSRRHGPDCPCNALALCSTCHHGDTVHGGPEMARQLGRIISKHATDRPAARPVEVHGQGVVLLTCDGTYKIP